MKRSAVLEQDGVGEPGEKGEKEGGRRGKGINVPSKNSPPSIEHRATWLPAVGVRQEPEEPQRASESPTCFERKAALHSNKCVWLCGGEVW